MSVPVPQSNVEQYLSVMAGHSTEVPSEPTSRVDYFLDEIVKSGGAGGAKDYRSLTNKPAINGAELSGNKTAADLGLVADTREVNGKPLSADVTLDKSDVGLGNVDNTSDADKPVSIAQHAALDQKVNVSAVGAANGVAELDGAGKVLSSQLPSYVDDVLECASQSAFPAAGESGKIYVAVDTNLTYRWTGSAYAEISPSIALGETSSTAYRGDRGKIAYDHSQTTGNAHNMTKADIGLSDVDNTSDANKPVSTAQKIALDQKADASDVDALRAENALLRELINGIDASIYRTASGNPATFNDGYPDNVKALSVTITPTQSGSGDPCLPGGGKNKLDLSGVSSVTSNGIAFTVVKNESGAVTEIIANGVAESGARLSLFPDGWGDPQKYAGMILSGCPANSGTYVNIEQNGTPWTNYAYDAGNGAKISDNVSSNCTFFWRFPAGTVADNLKCYPMIRSASDANPTFAPYANVRPVSGASSVSVAVHNAPSDTLSIPLTQSGSGVPSLDNVRQIQGVDCGSAGTVCAGTLDVATGTLSVTSRLLTESDFVRGGTNGAGVPYYNANLSAPYLCDLSNPGLILSNTLKTIPNADNAWYANAPCVSNGAGNSIRIYDTESDLSAFQTKYAGLQVAYPLAEPLTYQLTPAETQSLLRQLGYDGNRVTVSLVDSNNNPLTVYGGTVNVTAGTLTVTHKYFHRAVADMNNEEYFPGWKGTGVRDCVPPDYNALVSDAVVSIGASVRANFAYDILFFNAGDYGMTQSQWKERYPNLEIDVVLPLLSPRTYALTAAQIATLSGYNRAATDAQALSVKYRADPALSFGG